jgi:hypothetical protein
VIGGTVRSVEVLYNGETWWYKGKQGVTKIEEHSAQGEGDKWYYDIYVDDGKVIRVFNPVQVVFGVDVPQLNPDGSIPF